MTTDDWKSTARRLGAAEPRTGNGREGKPSVGILAPLRGIPPFDPREEPGTEREPALAEQLGQFVRTASGAFSSNTERALKSDLAIYAEWCAERGERALPARPETVAAFVDAKAESRAPATVRRYVTSLVIARRALGLPSIRTPTLVSERALRTESR